MFWKNRPLIITVILIIILLVLLFSTAGASRETGTQSLVGRVFAPLQQGLYDLTGSISGFFGGLFSSNDAARENAELQQRVAELESKLQDYDATVQENARLKELLGMAESMSDYEIVTARVIGKTPGVWFRQFTVNAGRDRGIEPNMIVMTGDGLMGRVVSVSDTFCKVMSLIDSDSGVPAIVERTRDYGVVCPIAVHTGEDGGDQLEMNYLPIDADVIPGDKILTSGIGGIYPKGLLIGQVSAVGTGEDSVKTVEIVSDVDFRHVEEVMIIKEVFAAVDSGEDES